MPDPLLYVEAFAAAGIASLCFAMALRRLTGRWAALVTPLAGLIACALGIVVGLAVLGINPRVLPRNGLDRFLLILLPAALAVELLSTSRRVPCQVMVCLRFVIAAASSWILLYGSVYLQSQSDEWTWSDMIFTLLVSSGGLFAAWEMVSWLEKGTSLPAAPYSLALSILVTGLLTMLGGYLKGGMVAFPFAAALVGEALSRRKRVRDELQRGTLGLGVVSLFGLLFIGRFFGSLSSITVVAVFAALLVGWLSEYVLQRYTATWQRMLIHLLLVAITLAILLAQAKHSFDRKLGPLLRGDFSNPPVFAATTLQRDFDRIC
jgi:hypothetical protein